MRENLPDLEPKSSETGRQKPSHKRKDDKFDLIELQTSVLQRNCEKDENTSCRLGTVVGSWTQAARCTNHASNKRLVFRIYKELSRPSSQQTKNERMGQT